MDMKRVIQACAVFFISILLASCQDVTSPEDVGSSSNSSSGGGSTEVNGYIQVDVYANWEGGTAQEQVGSSCTIPYTASTGTVKTCTIKIPELRLYYSDLTFKVSVPNSQTCTHVGFNPYYYKKSSSAVFKSDGVNTIDCSVSTSTIVSGCYGGAAPDMLSTLGISFPKFTGVYFLPANLLSMSYVLKAPNTRAKTDLDRVASSTNVLSANNLSNHAAGTLISSNMGGAGAVDYLNNSMVDYSFSCESKWYDDLYKIKIIIADEDDSTGTAINDTLYDWGAGD